MPYTGTSLERIRSEIEKQVSEAFNRVGLLFRIFGRVKSSHSLEKKMIWKGDNYSPNGKKLQDLIGIRIGVYFADDTELVQKILKDMYTIDSEACTIDIPDKNTFGPTRFNLIFKTNSLLPKPKKYEHLIDDTFEVQLRTILSEGWHEVEHDMRYKVKVDWDDSSELYRALNGIVATLETCDWSILQIFDKLAFKNYSNKNWNAMLRAKFRLRFQNSSIGKELLDFLNSNPEFSKIIYRFKRDQVLMSMYEKEMEFPLIYDNLIFLTNRLSAKNSDVISMEPKPINELFSERYFQS